MKKLLIYIILLLAAPTLFANDDDQQISSPDVSVGFDFGGTRPANNKITFKQVRPLFGLNFENRFSPLFALGIEGSASINTSSWYTSLRSSTAIDHSYVGVYGSFDILSLTSYYEPRLSLNIIAGCGWGHAYLSGLPDRNNFVAKIGLGIGYRISNCMSLQFKQFVLEGFNDDLHSAYSFQAGVSYSFGSSDKPINGYETSEVSAINHEVNQMRKKSEPIHEQIVDNRMNTVYDVFFHAGSAAISADQMTNVERIAIQMNNNPTTSVSIKGYASRDGSSKFNDKLAQQRAFAVRDSLISSFQISPARISAQGCGIGELFEKDSWNRVSVCSIFIK